MSVPAVNLLQLDNQLGIIDPGGERLAICGACSAGPFETPGIYARRSDVVATFGEGPMVESACYELEQTGKAVVLCRTNITTNGGYGAVDSSLKTGTSVVTANAGTQPYDDYEVYFKVTLGGTISTGPISYVYSLDGGRTLSAEQSLGTAVFALLPGNVRLNFAAGTLVTGDIVTVRTTAPIWNTAQLTTALTALQNTENQWGICLIEGQVVAGDVSAIATAGTAMENIGEEKTFVASFRVPNIGETEAQYKTAFDTAFGSSVADRLVLCAGGAEIQSPISSRQYLTRIARDIATALVSVNPGVDIAKKKLGPRPAAVRIKDAGNNPKHHDELLNPGLDDSRATTYRTWRRSRGVYVNNPRILSATGSDFKYAQHRRVMNAARTIVRNFLEIFASDDLLVNKTSGRILESEAADIDSVINDALRDGLIDTRDCSDAVFQLSRTDNILSTFTLSGALRVTPLAYPKTFNVTVAFYNPALKAQFPEV